MIFSPKVGIYLVYSIMGIIIVVRIFQWQGIWLVQDQYLDTLNKKTVLLRYLLYAGAVKLMHLYLI